VFPAKAGQFVAPACRQAGLLRPFGYASGLLKNPSSSDEGFFVL
jgi:hypothetical protein